MKFVWNLEFGIWDLTVMLDVNKALPLVMHIDLNSAFATIEQQANPFLRGQPVGVTNRLSESATILAASYDAKAMGIKTGTKVYEAKKLAPNIVILETDPDKYIYAHRLFAKILQSYSPDVAMKSIDEGVIDFSPVRLVEPRPLTEIGREIKRRVARELGEWVTCNIGIGANRFLAKFAAGLHKPNGMDVLDYGNLEVVYGMWNLRDLPGINWRMEKRLNLCGIYTPLQFLQAPLDVLWHQVFKSIGGYYWFRRLRGWEVDTYESATKTVGKQYVLPIGVRNLEQIEPVIMKLVQLMGRRLRKKGLCATGISVGLWLKDGQFWHQSRKSQERLYTTQQLYDGVRRLLAGYIPGRGFIKTIFMNCYGLLPARHQQLNLLQSRSIAQNWPLAEVIDSLNDRFGEFTLTPAGMANTQTEATPKIAFGNTKL